MAAGIGLLGTSGTLAAPANGVVIGDLAAAESAIQDAQWNRRRCRVWCRHWGYSYRRCWRRCWGW